MRCINCYRRLIGFGSCPCYWSDLDRDDTSEAKDMIDPVSEPDKWSTHIFTVSSRGYLSCRGNENGLLTECQHKWVDFDDVVWC